MKKIIASLMLAGLFTLPAMAQRGDQHTPEEKAKMMTERMTENLNLSADQKEAVYKANLEMAETMQTAHADAYKANQEKLKEILTEEQFKKMQELRSEHKKGMKGQKPRQKRQAQDSGLQEDSKTE